MARESELSLKAYKCKVQTSHLQIAKYQKAIQDKNALFVKNKAKVLKLKGDLLDKSKKLRKMDNYCFEQEQRAAHFEQVAKEAKVTVSLLKDQMTSMKK